MTVFTDESLPHVLCLSLEVKFQSKADQKKSRKQKVIKRPYYPTAWGLTCGKNAARAMQRNERDVDHPVPGAVDYHRPKTLGPRVWAEIEKRADAADSYVPFLPGLCSSFACDKITVPQVLC